MSTARSLTQASTLEFYRVALTNAESNPEIMEILRQNGLTAEILGEGNNLLSIAREVSKTANLKRTKRTETYKSYSKAMADVEERFLADKKKAHMAFLHDNIAQDKLTLNSRHERTYVKMIGIVSDFYTVVSENQDLAEQLAKFSLSSEVVTARLTAVSELEELKANYINEKGISQNATNAKKKALSNLKMWMSKFFDFAKNALKHEPQLMESLDVVVKE
ncbi:MAG: hypothetical protein PF495_05545 [Spirochaetales bacterium]|jgi:hypothetical protein|nr:hypothetical protein [Spirochaetales bacterium]